MFRVVFAKERDNFNNQLYLQAGEVLDHLPKGIEKIIPDFCNYFFTKKFIITSANTRQIIAHQCKLFSSARFPLGFKHTEFGANRRRLVKKIEHQVL